MNREHMTDLHHPVPATARHRTMHPGYVDDPAHKNHLSARSGPSHATDRLIGHARSQGHLVAVLPLFVTLDHGSPFRWRDLEAEDQLLHEGRPT
jgi:hypothetical protein